MAGTLSKPSDKAIRVQFDQWLLGAHHRLVVLAGRKALNNMTDITINPAMEVARAVRPRVE